MCSTIMSKVFKCSGIPVLAFLLEALQCIFKLCNYFGNDFKKVTIKKKVECYSIYNPSHAETTQMDCFRLVAEIQHFLKRLRMLIDDIECEHELIQITRIALVKSHFLQDFVVRYSDFHAIPPPPFRVRNRRRSIWRY